MFKANLKFKKLSKNKEYITVNINETSVAEFVIRSSTLPFPVDTRLLPFPLVQMYGEKHYYTTFFGSGTGHLAKIDELKINPELFPDISQFKPIAILKVEPFSITFPKAKIEDAK